MIWNKQLLPLKAIHHVKFSETTNHQVFHYNACCVVLWLSSVLNKKNQCSTNKTLEQREVLLSKINDSIDVQNFEVSQFIDV